MARRNAKTGATRKSTPTGRGKYSGKYVLSNLLFCGECGTAYRRCVWTQHGMKRPVWRCVSRLDYGKKFCTHSPTLDEEPLQQAILAAVNAVMLDRDTLARQLAAVMEWELAPVLGESMSLADMDRALEELSGQFNSLLAEASANPAEDYMERFRSEYFPEGKGLTKEEVVFQLGDFGGVWFGDDRDDEALDWLEGLPFTVTAGPVPHRPPVLVEGGAAVRGGICRGQTKPGHPWLGGGLCPHPLRPHQHRPPVLTAQRGGSPDGLSPGN